MRYRKLYEYFVIKTTMNMRALFILFLLYKVDSLSPVPQGFPILWDGDHFTNSPCLVVQTPPSWLSGCFLCQVCASYGDQRNERGQKVTHMFDAIGAMAVFDFEGGNCTFTASYYPSRSYKIWNFHGRDFRKSQVAWGTFSSTVNVSAMESWEAINTEFGSSPPNAGFWKIGDTIVAGTEFYQLGLTFDLPTLDHFHPYPFRDSTPLLTGHPLIPIHMPIHERTDPDTGLLWATVSALNISTKIPSLHQVIFTVDQSGSRSIQGIFNYDSFDPIHCTDDDVYEGPNGSLLPRYIHAITSTINYLILPLSSSVMNPCKILSGAPVYPPKVTLYDPEESWLFEWDPTAPMMFLLFDKRMKEFLQVLATHSVQFVTHQFNAYESSPDHVFVDMITCDTDPYQALKVHNLTQPLDLYPLASMHALRFTIDLDTNTITNRSLLPQNPTSIEFAQFNHRFEGKQYKYGYAVTFPYFAGNQIVKIDMDIPNGMNNKAFQPNGQSISLSEPYFVQRPGATEEDDGVVIVRGLDTIVNNTRVYVLNAKTMEQMGEVLAPILVPFGFHDKFYMRESLNGIN